LSNKVEVRGLKEFQRELRKLQDKQVNAELAALNQKAAQLVVDNVRPVSRQQAKVAGGIRAAKTFKAAVVSTKNTKRTPFAVGAFFGARRYKQFQPWIGNQWDPGDSVSASYGVPHAIAAHLDEIVDVYGDGIEALAAKAFPSR
jgi:hypothetical protein